MAKENTLSRSWSFEGVIYTPESKDVPDTLLKIDADAAEKAANAEPEEDDSGDEDDDTPPTINKRVKRGGKR